MRLLRLMIALAIAVALLSSPTTTRAEAPKVKHWKITTSAVGPLQLGDSLRDLKRAGYTFYPCGGKSGGHPCYFKGKLGKVMGFDVDEHRKVKQLMVNARSGHGYAFATKSGVHVGSTVKTLKAKEHAAYLGNYGYGDAFAVHQGKHQWITFFASGKKASSTIYSISVSTTKKPPQGR
ncbi:hypothetical protein [Nocardioides panacisoli]|uniref:Uncharacterized protein n=1 Tax=Nocardioides panacisoli TaxID=627624 RepID=A0ABP7IVL3_9ACTN